MELGPKVWQAWAEIIVNKIEKENKKEHILKDRIERLKKTFEKHCGGEYPGDYEAIKYLLLGTRLYFTPAEIKLDKIVICPENINILNLKIENIKEKYQYFIYKFYEEIEHNNKRIKQNVSKFFLDSDVFPLYQKGLDEVLPVVEKPIYQGKIPEENFIKIENIYCYACSENDDYYICLKLNIENLILDFEDEQDLWKAKFTFFATKNVTLVGIDEVGQQMKAKTVFFIEKCQFLRKFSIAVSNIFRISADYITKKAWEQKLEDENDNELLDYLDDYEKEKLYCFTKNFCGNIYDYSLIAEVIIEVEKKYGIENKYSSANFVMPNWFNSFVEYLTSEEKKYLFNLNGYIGIEESFFIKKKLRDFMRSY